MTRRSLAPTMVSAATRALTMASSVASTVASKNGVTRSFGRNFAVGTPSVPPEPEFAVENAMKMSPDELLATPPVRAMPLIPGA